jgi:Ca2+/H+ antiporter
VPAVRQKLHLSPCADFRDRLSGTDAILYVEALTLLVGVITLGTGRTTVLQGVVHLVIFAVFLFFAVVP